MPVDDCFFPLYQNCTMSELQPALLCTPHMASSLIFPVAAMMGHRFKAIIVKLRIPVGACVIMTLKAARGAHSLRPEAPCQLVVSRIFFNTLKITIKNLSDG